MDLGEVTGQPALMIRDSARACWVFTLEVKDRRIQTIRTRANPEKLACTHPHAGCRMGLSLHRSRWQREAEGLVSPASVPACWPVGQHLHEGIRCQGQRRDQGCPPVPPASTVAGSGVFHRRASGVMSAARWRVPQPQVLLDPNDGQQGTLDWRER